MSQARRVPSYGLHKATGQARVIINGKHIYLGEHGSPASHAEYHRLVAEWLVSGSPQDASSEDRLPPPVIAVNQLILAFWEFAERKYVKNGEPTSEIRSYRTALDPVHELYGRQPVTAFGPLALVACRERLLEAGICRKRINDHVGRIRRVFKWGVSRELVPETTWRALMSVEGLRRGEAYDPPAVEPAKEEYIDAIKPHVSPQVWAMIQLQLWTGCRPGEVCDIRTADLDMRGKIWEYRPVSHKLEHHGKERVIYLGPHAQAVVRPWLRLDLNAYLFSPREATQWHREQRSKKARGKKKPNQRQRKRNPQRQAGDHYITVRYDVAVRRACLRAGVPPWTPNQLRHTAGTRIREAYGIEAARIILGHSSAVTSELYAKFDSEKAKSIMQQMG